MCEIVTCRPAAQARSHIRAYAGFMVVPRLTRGVDARNPSRIAVRTRLSVLPFFHAVPKMILGIRTPAVETMKCSMRQDVCVSPSQIPSAAAHY